MSHSGQEPPPRTAEEAPSIEDLAAERDDVKDRLLRTAADFDNFRKRVNRELEAAERRGKEETLRAVLPIVDNLERAAAAAQTAEDVASVVQGVDMILARFRDIADKLGLERLISVGQRFDPSLHEAVQQQETTEHPPGTVIAELAPGYRLGDKVLRAAVVVVARAPG